MQDSTPFSQTQPNSMELTPAERDFILSLRNPKKSMQFIATLNQCLLLQIDAGSENIHVPRITDMINQITKLYTSNL